MSPQKFIAVLVVSSGLLAACTGAVPSSSAKKPAKDAKTYSIPTGAGDRKVIITDDRVEVVVAGRERECSSNQTIQELKNLREANKAMEERLRALEKLHGDGKRSRFRASSNLGEQHSYLVFRRAKYGLLSSRIKSTILLFFREVYELYEGSRIRKEIFGLHI